MRVLTQDLCGVRGRQRFGHPGQDAQTSPGQRRSVEIPLQDLRSLRRVEAGRIVRVAARNRSLDGASSERLGASLSNQGINASADRVPHHFGEPWDEPEGVEHHAGTVLRERAVKVKSRSSTLVRVVSAAPGASISAGASRSRVLPEPWGPLHPAVRSQGTRRIPRRAALAPARVASPRGRRRLIVDHPWDCRTGPDGSPWCACANGSGQAAFRRRRGLPSRAVAQAPTVPDPDFDKALNIIVNAKTQRVGVRNAAGSRLVDHAVADALARGRGRAA